MLNNLHNHTIIKRYNLHFNKKCVIHILLFIHYLQIFDFKSARIERNAYYYCRNQNDERETPRITDFKSVRIERKAYCYCRNQNDKRETPRITDFKSPRIKVNLFVTVRVKANKKRCGININDTETQQHKKTHIYRSISILQ